MWTVDQNVYHPTDSRPSLKCLNHSNVLAWFKACSPKASFSIRWVSAAVLLSLKQNLMQVLRILNHTNFNIRRHSWKWCKENSQNSETRALIKTPVARLLVERHKKKNLAAQVRSANGLRGIFKSSEILGSTTYMIFIFIIIVNCKGSDDLKMAEHGRNM